MKIAVLGPGGLVGSGVMAALQARGHEPVGIGRRKAERKVDLAQPAEIGPALFADCAAMIHCAGVTDEEVNADCGAAAARAMDGTQKLIAAARAAGVVRFAYISSAHVYGPLTGEIDETRVVDPRSNYALLHYAAEQVLRRMALPVEAALILRPCAVFGPLPDPRHFQRWSLIPFSFPRDAAQRSEIRLASHGLQRRNFISSVAIGAVLADWLQAGTPGLRVTNAVGVDDLSVFEFANLTAKIAERVTGQPCRVTRPESGSSAEAPLSYRSRTERPRSGFALPDHLEAIIKAYGHMGAHS